MSGDTTLATGLAWGGRGHAVVPVWWPVPDDRYHLAAAPGVRNDTNVGVMAADSGALAAAEVNLEGVAESDEIVPGIKDPFKR